MLEEIFYSEALPYAVLFLLFFGVLMFLLRRSFFGKESGLATIIAICSSALIVWGLTNYTNLVFSFADILNGLSRNLQTIIYLIVIFLILFLLYQGLKRWFKSGVIEWGWFGVGGALILIYFLPQIFNPYILPDFLKNGFVRWGGLVLGIIFCLIGLKRTFRWKPWKVTEQGGREWGRGPGRN
jgi:hypothetical protein